MVAYVSLRALCCGTQWTAAEVVTFHERLIYLGMSPEAIDDYEQSTVRHPVPAPPREPVADFTDPDAWAEAVSAYAALRADCVGVCDSGLEFFHGALRLAFGDNLEAVEPLDNLETRSAATGALR